MGDNKTSMCSYLYLVSVKPRQNIDSAAPCSDTTDRGVVMKGMRACASYAFGICLTRRSRDMMLLVIEVLLGLKEHRTDRLEMSRSDFDDSRLLSRHHLQLYLCISASLHGEMNKWLVPKHHARVMSELT
jgi:hypothetical protein